VSKWPPPDACDGPMDVGCPLNEGSMGLGRSHAAPDVEHQSHDINLTGNVSRYCASHSSVGAKSVPIKTPATLFYLSFLELSYVLTH
jgi:hypothetical protein